jgi:DNA adenine methylase
MLRYAGSKKRGPIRRAVLDKLCAYRAFNTYQEYREPFCGSCAIGFALIADGVKQVWFNDLDPGIAHLWDAVFNHSTQLESLITAFVPSTDAFFKLRKELRRSDHKGDSVAHGFKKLALNRISYSGLGTMAGGPQGGKAGLRIAERWLPAKLIKDMRAVKQFMAHVQLRGDTCTCHDFEEVIRAAGRSLIYLDPPYFANGSRLYQYGFTNDHERLAECLRHCEHDWVLTYDDCVAIRKLYDWANVVTITTSYSISKPTRKNELVITRNPDNG